MIASVRSFCAGLLLALKLGGGVQEFILISASLSFTYFAPHAFSPPIIIIF